jgi:hypothetical protein
VSPHAIPLVLEAYFLSSLPPCPSTNIIPHAEHHKKWGQPGHFEIDRSRFKG